MWSKEQMKESQSLLHQGFNSDQQLVMGDATQFAGLNPFLIRASILTQGQARRGLADMDISVSIPSTSGLLFGRILGKQEMTLILRLNPFCTRASILTEKRWKQKD
ncbi:MAG: hypothetical protein ACLP5H_20355 [Desulfomonilaceae bacterium]